jgi:hypothetical protein
VSEQKALPLPQLIVPRLAETVPFPLLETVSGYVCSVNVAVTDRACDIVTWHVAVPLQPSPDQPEKIHPALGEAFRVTSVPFAYLLVHVAPQLRLPLSAVTAPEPTFATSSG